MNHLYYGDNLQVMRESIQDESIDLVYLDPPFNSKRDYNLLFNTPKGHKSEAQIAAFKDSWHWGEQAEGEYFELLKQANTDVALMIRALREFLKESDMMAYITMMASRLLELHRVMKPTASLYLHCDPTASHYLKILLDGVFGKSGFRSEIIWRRSGAHNSANRFGPIHDTILFYTRSDEFTWNRLYSPYAQGYIQTFFNKTDNIGNYRCQTLTGAGTRKGASGTQWRQYDPTSKGRHWAFPRALARELGIEELPLHDKLDYLADNGMIVDQSWLPEYRQYLQKSPGVPLQDIWAYQPFTNGSVWGTQNPIDDDVRWISDRNDPERLGYPTQKPLGLLSRIISASSNPGDVVLDPFCGCGTAVHAAHRLKRNWIGIDITCLAVGLIEKRLKDAFKEKCKFDVHGTPKDLESARDLAERDKYQFQWWAVTLIEAQPYQGKKKGADGGIDGLKFFYDVPDTEARKIVVSVKGGDLKADDVRALNHVRDREKADIAILISLKEPTAGMKKDAASAGFFEWKTIDLSPTGKKSSRVQLLTIEGLLAGTHRADHPSATPHANFKKARREKANKPKVDLFEEDGAEEI